MKYVTSFIGAAALAISSYTVEAGTLTAGGVVWDEFGEKGIAGSINFQQWYSANSFDSASGITETGVVAGNIGFGYLTGVGVISALFDGREPNGNMFGGAPYCVTPGCLLTFSFGGLQAKSFVPGTGFIFDTSAAWLNIYYHSTVPALGAVDTNLFSKYSLIQGGSLWATLSFDGAVLNGNSLSGAGGTFEALMSIQSGLPDVVALLGNKNISDIFLNSSALINSSTGRSNIASGQFESIPAPTSIALLGLGLLGLAGGRRFKKA